MRNQEGTPEEEEVDDHQYNLQQYNQHHSDQEEEEEEEEEDDPREMRAKFDRIINNFTQPSQPLQMNTQSFGRFPQA